MLQHEDSALAAHQEPLDNHTCSVLIYKGGAETDNLTPTFVEMLCLTFF